MKTNTRLMVCLAGMLPASLAAQTVIDSGTFYDPDFKVRRQGATSGLLNLSVTNAPVSGSQSSGNTTWTHQAGGHAQVRTRLSVPIVGTTLANLDAQLAATTETTGNSLVFGREITTDAEILGIVDAGPALQGLTNQVAGASVLYGWESDATVTGLMIAPEQLYSVTFEVTSGAGLPVNLLSSSTFGITNDSVTGASNESAELLDLANLVILGNGSSTGTFTFDFMSSQALSQLDFNFAASTGVGVTALGGTADNQNVLTFSNLQVTQVPEPSAVLISVVGLGGLFVFRRRRTSAGGLR